jgi:hypothetical protein
MSIRDINCAMRYGCICKTQRNPLCWFCDTIPKIFEARKNKELCCGFTEEIKICKYKGKYNFKGIPFCKLHLQKVNPDSKGKEFECVASEKDIKGFVVQHTLNEKNDCVVRSLASVCDAYYEEVHTYCKETFERKNCKGVRYHLIKDTLKNAEDTSTKIFNNNVEEIDVNKYKNENKYKVYTLSRWIKDFPKGKFLLFVKGHAICLKDGVLYGNSTENQQIRRQVKYAWKFTN